MQKNEDGSGRAVRTDLACELAAGARGAGVSMSTAQERGVELTVVEVVNERGARRIGKPMGTYVTARSDALAGKEPEARRDLAEVIAARLRDMLPELGENETVLVLGLGNSAVTPDALGGKTVAHVLVSRHVVEHLPELVDERVRSVCAIAPGVLGVTGMESGEIALGIVETVRPACVIAIDSLAAMSLGRVLTTVQLADTGICPGSGLNNPRRELTRRTLGVPVIAVGVPLVVSAVGICRDALEGLGGGQTDVSDERIADALGGAARDMVVTPKDIDEAVDSAAQTIAMAINMAVHRDISYDELLGMHY